MAHKFKIGDRVESLGDGWSEPGWLGEIIDNRESYVQIKWDNGKKLAHSIRTLVPEDPNFRHNPNYLFGRRKS